MDCTFTTAEDVSVVTTTLIPSFFLLFRSFQHGVKKRCWYGVQRHQRAGHGPAQVDGLRVVARRTADLAPQLLNGLADRSVQHQSERPLLVMLDHQEHGLDEVRIQQLRRSDQQLAFERFH